MDSISSLPGISLSILQSEVYESSSTIQYVNSQLVAHGFTRSPGLSLEGLANPDSERLVKCLLNMLSQRMEDLGRTEEQASKLRTLTYEHERLTSMHRTAVENGANAEREMNFHKSKLAAAQRSLASETTAHKQTLAELQRTRTALQYLRSTTQNELKRKDKEVERVLDRWNKVADAQVKLSGVKSGLQCVNLAVGIHEHARGKGIMEEALEQAEEARCSLLVENEGFRTVILRTANLIQGMNYDIKALHTEIHLEEPTPITHVFMFSPPTSSLSCPENAQEKLRELMATLREATSFVSPPRPPAFSKAPETDEEIAKLNNIITSLQKDLEKYRKASNEMTTKTQTILDKFTTHASERLITGREPTPSEAAEMSMELISVPERDETRDKLEKRAKDLEEERTRFTQATIKLGKEKAALEAERAKMIEEKRRWAVEQMLAELPPSPGPDPDLISVPQPQTKQSSPRRGAKVTLKSPSKKLGGAKRVGADSPKKKLRFRRDSTVFETVEVCYEDKGELERSTTPEDSPPNTDPNTAPPQTLAAELKIEMKTSLPLVLPTTFKLPPPSPASSLAASDLQAISAPVASTSACNEPSLSIEPRTSHPTQGSHLLSSPQTISSPASAHPPLTRSRIFPAAATRIFPPPAPRTPRTAHLKHAYSPARPSPLSRILMIADSPGSPPSVPVIPEEEEDSDPGEKMTCGRPVPEAESSTDDGCVVFPRMAEIVPLDEVSVLRERKGDRNGNATGKVLKVAGVASEKGISLKPPSSVKEKRFTAKEKGKGRAVPALPEKKRVASIAPERGRATTIQKENIQVKNVATVRVPGSRSDVVVRPGGAKRVSVAGGGGGTSKSGGKMI